MNLPIPGFLWTHAVILFCLTRSLMLLKKHLLVPLLGMRPCLINNMEEATRDQSLSEQWKNECKFRFTASKFDLISKTQRSHEKFAADLINPKLVFLRCVEHGIKNESIAIKQYEKIIFTQIKPVKVLKTGFVVCLDMPFLGASPDGRVVDFGSQNHFGLAEASTDKV